MAKTSDFAIGVCTGLLGFLTEQADFARKGDGPFELVPVESREKAAAWYDRQADKMISKMDSETLSAVLEGLRKMNNRSN